MVESIGMSLHSPPRGKHDRPHRRHARVSAPTDRGGNVKRREHRAGTANNINTGSRDLLYGRQPIREMLRAGRRRVDILYLQRGRRPSPELDEIMRLAQERHLRIQDMDGLELDALSGGGHHQGLAALASPFRYVSYKKFLSDAEREHAPLFLILDHLEDPQNVGSLLRSAEAAGVHGVVIPEHRAVGVTPAVVRASAGAAEHLAVSQVPNLVRCMRLLRERGVRFAGLENSPDARELETADLTGPMGLVVGSEGRGLRRLVREHCDVCIRLPMRGRVESLNAAVAGAIALFEAIRQRAHAEAATSGAEPECPSPPVPA